MSEAAARHYRELAARNSEAVKRMRAEDELRVTQLTRSLLDSEALVARAGLDEEIARASIITHWENAVEAMWNERWLAMEPIPKPADPAPNLSIAAADAEVERSYEALHEALRRPSVLPRFRK